MAFNWIQFFDRHRIDYVTSGPSVTKGHIAIRCVWCGNSDQSHHLAISLSGAGYKCWRAPQQHKGRAAAKLIQALLDCTWTEAFNIAGEGSRGAALSESDFTARAQALLNGGKKAVSDTKTLTFLPEFRPLLAEGVGLRFVNYMAERGYPDARLPALHRIYGLQCAIMGSFRYRVIFPVYMRGKLATWTGRAITNNADLRYYTLSANPDVAEEKGLPQAAMSIEKTLWNFDELLKGGEELYICEGPFDALRLDSIGRRHFMRATCVFKKQVSAEQAALLDEVVPRFARSYLLFDPEAYADTLVVRSQLAHLKLGTRTLPPQFEDPGALSVKATRQFLGVS